MLAYFQVFVLILKFALINAFKNKHKIISEKLITDVVHQCTCHQIKNHFGFKTVTVLHFQLFNLKFMAIIKELHPATHKCQIVNADADADEISFSFFDSFVKKTRD